MGIWESESDGSSSGVELGETSTTAYRGDRGKTAYDHSQTTHNKSLVGLSNVPNLDTSNPANIMQDENHRFATDTEKTVWNSKVSPTGSDAALTRQMFKDCGYVVVDKGNSGTTAQVFDCEDGNVQTLTVTGNFSFTITNWVPTGNFGELVIIFQNAGTATIGFPTTNWVKPDGTITTSISEYLTANTGRTTLQTSGTDIFYFYGVSGSTPFGGLV